MSRAAPQVSFVIPCYNQGAFLYQSVSAAEASYAGPKQIVIVDDGSTVASTGRHLDEVAARFSSVQVVRQANRGLSGARNAGLDACTGEFVQLLDADDLIAPGKVDYQVAHLAVARGVDVSITDFLLCDETKSHFSKPGEPIAPFAMGLRDFLYTWERGFAIPIHCALFRRPVFDEHRFDEAARAKEDWLFWCSLAARGRRMAYLRSHDAIYRQHASSMRRSVVSMGKAWLTAALKVDAMVSRREPGFFDSAVNWFNEYYRKHPDYAAELADPAGFAGVQKPVAHDDDVTTPEDLSGLSLDAFRARPGHAPVAISVVVPIYNHFRYLRACIESVLSQDLDGVELVCVDDASPDPRVGALLDRLAGQSPRLKVIRNAANRGISAVQNQAVEAARGEFVAFLDCDDELAPGALHAVADAIASDRDADYFFTDRLDVDENGKTLRVAVYGGYDTIRPSGDVRNDLLDGMVASHLKVMRRSRYLALGGCDDSVSGAQDWDLALRFALSGRLHYLPKPLYRHRIHTQSVTRSDSVAQMRRTNVIRRRFASRILRPGSGDGPAFLGPALALDDVVDVLGQRVAGVEGVRWFAPADVSLAAVKKAYRDGQRCVFDARDAYAVPWINFLREFNSYFDLVVFEQPEVYAALNGYLWSEDLLRSTLRRAPSAGAGSGAPDR